MIRIRRRFNYTSRQKIRMDSISIIVANLGDPEVNFSCDVNLNQYAFPAGAAIYVDVNRGSYAFRRFSMGTVGSPLRISNQPLPEFSSYPAITFYVSVVDSRDGYKNILGKSTAISLPRTAGGSETAPLLEVSYRQNMKQLWKLDFDSDRPILQVRNEIDAEGIIKHNHLFRTAVFPAVLKEILVRYLIIEHGTIDEDDDESDRSRWIRFAKEVCGVTEIGEEDDEDEVAFLAESLENIERVVDAFSEKFLKEELEMLGGDRSDSDENLK
jgi:hypothetical protein